MALTKCSECGNQVSDRAAVCPGCGVAIAAAEEYRAAGAHLTTIQGTSKKLKMHTLLSGLLFVMGLVFMFSMPEAATAEESPTPIPVLMVVAGLAWWLVTRFRIWWHHK